ncbi:hypothetical protein [uncultured Sphingomonas sp.]|nr:hypothetical protein [uncultured Sphingomonas sp.]
MLHCALIALGLSVSLVACGNHQSSAEAAVRDSLKDPESARFGEFYFNEKTGKGCLSVNAKNSMGGYTGDQQAYLRLKDSTWEVEGISEVSHESCRNTFADTTF